MTTLLVTGMLRKRLDLSPSRDYQNIPLSSTRLRWHFRPGTPIKRDLASKQDLFIDIPETQLQGRSPKLYRFEMVKIIEDQSVVIDIAKCKERHNNAMTTIPRCIVEAEIL